MHYHESYKSLHRNNHEKLDVKGEHCSSISTTISIAISTKWIPSSILAGKLSATPDTRRLSTPSNVGRLSRPPHASRNRSTSRLLSTGCSYTTHQANLIKLIGFAGIALVVTMIAISAVIADNFTIIVLLILLAVTIYAVWYLVTNFNLKAYVFTKGLIRAQGSKIDVMRWEHVVSSLHRTVVLWNINCVRIRRLKYAEVLVGW